MPVGPERAYALGGDVLDCGIVDPWNNTVEEWQAALAPVEGCFDFLGAPCFSCEGLSNGETLGDIP